MLFKWTRLTSLARHAVVASMSLLLVVTTMSFALSPAESALAANVSVKKTHGHEAIEGAVKGKAKGVIVRVIAREHGRLVVLRTVKLGANGRFDVSVKPGQYKVVIQDGKHKVARVVKVTKGHSEYFGVTVVKKGGGFGIAPVVFNY